MFGLQPASHVVKLVVVTLFAMTGRLAFGCSTFCYGNGESGIFVARNYDWSSGEGLVVINKQGVKKRALTLSRPATWTSKHGSVSFCQYGREFPCDGMNDAGLMVTVLWLDDSQYAGPDQRPTISTLQWVQYQLDVAGSVAEVVNSVDDLRIESISGAAIHYFVCDKTGDCATIEILDGKAVVHHGKPLVHRCLTNSTCAASTQAANDLQAFGGNRPTGDTGGSMDRFGRAAIAADPKNWPAEIDEGYGFKILADLGRTDFTKWRIVYDLNKGVIHFRTEQFPDSRYVRLADFDWTQVTPVMVCNMNTDDRGDLHDAFQPYTVALNRQILTTAVQQSGVLNGTPNAAQLMELAIAYPDLCGSPADLKAIVPAR